MHDTNCVMFLQLLNIFQFDAVSKIAYVVAYTFFCVINDVQNHVAPRCDNILEGKFRQHTLLSHPSGSLHAPPLTVPSRAIKRILLIDSRLKFHCNEAMPMPDIISHIDIPVQQTV